MTPWPSHHTHAFIFMKYTFELITLSLLLTACSRRDAMLTHQVAGVWQDGPTKITFNSDGGFANHTIDGRGTNDFAGTWKIADGVLTMVLTSVSGSKPDGRVGDVVHLKIVDADEHHISVSIGGQTNTFNR